MPAVRTDTLAAAGDIAMLDPEVYLIKLSAFSRML